MRTRQFNPEVLFAEDAVRVFSPGEAANLGLEVLASQSGKMRICLHQSPDAALHEMLVGLRRDVRYPPHRNRKSEETHFILQGIATLLLYRDDGPLSERIPLGDPASGRPGYSRIPANVFHCLEIESEVCVFLETKLGPFDPANIEFLDAPYGTTARSS